MSKQVAKTTLNYRGVEYPFYKTNRGNWDFETAGFSNDGVRRGNARDMLALIYFTLRDCAKRSARVFEDDLDTFVDNADDGIEEVFIRLKEEKERINKEEAIKLGKLPRREPELKPERELKATQNPVPTEMPTDGKAN